MDINSTNLTGMFDGFNVHFNKGLALPKAHMQTIAMTTVSSGASETYAWLGESLSIRRWIGDRLLNDLKAHRYTIINELFERKPLGIMPSHLVVPPSLEGKARRLLVALSENDGSNEWAGSVELIVTPFLA